MNFLTGSIIGLALFCSAFSFVYTEKTTRDAVESLFLASYLLFLGFNFLGPAAYLYSYTPSFVTETFN